MIAYLLAIALLLQTPLRPTEGGTITGIVKTTGGKPAVGVRVTARARPESLDQFQEGIAMSSIAMTDPNGHYRLENVPPGRYFVAAGNLDLPTYYPGTLDVGSGTVIQITPGAQRSGIDFALADLSLTLAGQSGGRPGYTIPLQVEVEGGGKLPIFSPNGLAMLAMQRSGTISDTYIAFNGGAITLPFPITTQDYAARVVNVPEGYTVKSITYGATNLLTELLRLSAANIPLTSNQAPGATFTLRSTVLPQTQSIVVNGPAVSAGALSATSPTALSITLTPAPLPPMAGPRITGQAAPGALSVWLGNRPGFLYADGTFELRGVSPGLHIILASHENAAGPQSQHSGASVVVGDRDMDGLQLDPVPLLPREWLAARPASRPAGTKIPLATIKGRLVSAATQKPVLGTVNIVGWNTQVSYVVDADGRFEIPKLLPGSYNLTASIFDYYTLNESIVVGEEDSNIELRARPAF